MTLLLLLQVADLGVAHFFDTAGGRMISSGMLTTTEGTKHYMAPECITKKKYAGYPVDMWALGVTM